LVGVNSTAISFSDQSQHNLSITQSLPLFRPGRWWCPPCVVDCESASPPSHKPTATVPQCGPKLCWLPHNNSHLYLLTHSVT